MKRICVYCGSKPGKQPAYVDAARDLGRRLASRDIGLVYGGAHVGTMGAIADEVLAAGGEVQGVMPHGLVAMEVAHDALSELFVVDTLHERKAKMVELSDGLITLPGGFGSHDELFEALTWLQLGVHDMPVGLLNVRGYYDGLLAHLEHCGREGFLPPETRGLLLDEAEPDRLLERMASWSPPPRPAWRSGA